MISIDEVYFLMKNKLFLIWSVVSEEKSLEDLAPFLLPHLAQPLSPLVGQTLFNYKFWSPPLGDHFDHVSSKSDQWFQMSAHR